LPSLPMTRSSSCLAIPSGAYAPISRRLIASSTSVQPSRLSTRTEGRVVGQRKWAAVGASNWVCERVMDERAGSVVKKGWYLDVVVRSERSTEESVRDSRSVQRVFSVQRKGRARDPSTSERRNSHWPHAKSVRENTIAPRTSSSFKPEHSSKICGNRPVTVPLL
jgi:hypothetical protein